MTPPRGGKPKRGLPRAPTRRSPTPGRPPAGSQRRSGGTTGNVGRGKVGSGTSGSGASGGSAGGEGTRPSQPRASRATRAALGGEQVEGRQAVRELLLGHRRKVQEIWLLAEMDSSPIVDDIVHLAQGERIPLKEVSRAKFFAEARCEAPQGVLAKAAPLTEVPLDDLTTALNGAPPFLVAVDGVTDPGNLGALLRSAECAGVTGVLLPRHRAVHITPTVTKAAAGAVEHLRFAVVGGLPAALQQLQKAGVWVVGLDGDGDTNLWSMPAADGPIALVMGAEGSGLSRLVKQRCDALVGIPLSGSLGSLNVSAAGALACFEVARARA